MALIECKECGHKVSDEAKTCPSCGVGIPKKTSKLKKLFWIVMLIVFWKPIAFIFGDHEPRSTATYTPPPTPEKKEPFGEMLNYSLTMLKASLKDPSSLILEQVLVEKNGISSCITYRAKNGFGGFDRQTTIFTDGKMLQASQKNLNKHCTENMHDATAIAKW